MLVEEPRHTSHDTGLGLPKKSLASIMDEALPWDEALPPPPPLPPRSAEPEPHPFELHAGVAWQVRRDGKYAP